MYLNLIEELINIWESDLEVEKKVADFYEWFNKKILNKIVNNGSNKIFLSTDEAEHQPNNNRRIESKYFFIEKNIELNEQTEKFLNIILKISDKYYSYYNSWIDPLTEIFNRKYLKEIADNWFKHKTNACVIILDIDHFKHINDTFGHKTGDEVLQKFGRIIRENISKEMQAIRYGGEEFLILLESADKKFILSFTENIRKNIENYNFNIERKITSSFGIFIKTEKGIDLATGVHKADIALYSSKNNGRNQYTVYEDTLNNIKKFYLWGESNTLFSGQIHACFWRNKIIILKGNLICFYQWNDNIIEKTLYISDASLEKIIQFEIFDNELVIVKNELIISVNLINLKIKKIEEFNNIEKFYKRKNHFYVKQKGMNFIRKINIGTNEEQIIEKSDNAISDFLVDANEDIFTVDKNSLFKNSNKIKEFNLQIRQIFLERNNIIIILENNQVVLYDSEFYFYQVNFKNISRKDKIICLNAKSLLIKNNNGRIKYYFFKEKNFSQKMDLVYKDKEIKEIKHNNKISNYKKVEQTDNTLYKLDKEGVLYKNKQIIDSNIVDFFIYDNEIFYLKFEDSKEYIKYSSKEIILRNIFAHNILAADRTVYLFDAVKRQVYYLKNDKIIKDKGISDFLQSKRVKQIFVYEDELYCLEENEKKIYNLKTNKAKIKLEIYRPCRICIKGKNIIIIGTNCILIYKKFISNKKLYINFKANIIGAVKKDKDLILLDNSGRAIKL